MLAWISAGVLFGVVLLLLVPPLVNALDWLPGASSIGNAYVSVAMRTLSQPAISVSNTTSFSLRKRGYDSTYDAETISSGGQSMKLKQIPKSVVRWGGRPFTFVDETFGVCFDLRDVAVGRREHELRQDGQMTFENRIYGQQDNVLDAYTFVRGFFDLDAGHQTLDMDLDDSLHPIVDGSEDAGQWERVREGVRRMFLSNSKLGLIRIAMPFLGFVAGMMAAFYLFGPGQMPGGGSSVSVGALLPFALGGGDDGDDDEDDESRIDFEELAATASQWLRQAGESAKAAGGATVSFLQSVSATTYKRLAAALVVVVAVVVAVLVAGVVPVAVLGITAGVVAVGVPLASGVVGGILPRMLCEPIAETWTNIGLMAFDDPIISQEAEQVVVVEAEETDSDSGERYRMCKQWVGFALHVDADAMGHAGNDRVDLSDYRGTGALPDGGDMQLPTGWEPTEVITRADHNGLVPTTSEADSSTVYIRSDLWLSQTADVATGAIAARSHRESLKEFADGRGFWTDGRIMQLFIGLGILGLAFGFMIWGLLI